MEKDKVHQVMVLGSEGPDRAGEGKHCETDLTLLTLASCHQSFKHKDIKCQTSEMQCLESVSRYIYMALDTGHT